MKKVLYYTILWLFVGILSIIIGLELMTSILYKDKVHDHIQTLISQNVASKVSFDDLNISLFKNFPTISIALDSLEIEEQGKQIAAVGQVSVLLNLNDFLNGQYIIEKAEVSGASYHILVDSTGQKIKLKTRPKPPKAKAKTNIKLDIPLIEVKDSRVVVKNDYKQNEFRISLDDATLKMEALADFLSLNGEVSGRLDTMIINGGGLAGNISLHAREANFRVNLLEKKQIFDGLVLLDNVELQAYGVINPVGTGNLVDITIDSRTNDMEKYFNLIPFLKGLGIRQLDSDAKLSIKVKNTGLVSPTRAPLLEIYFDLANGKFKRDSWTHPFEDVYLKGYFTNGRTGTPKIKIEKGQVHVADNYLNVEGDIESFEDPILDVVLSSELILEDFKTVLEIPKQNVFQGKIEVESVIKGRLSELEKMSRKGDRKFEGAIKFIDIATNLWDTSDGIDQLNGEIKVKNEKIYLNNIHGYLDHSPFKITGHISNYVPLLLTEQHQKSRAALNVYIDKFHVPHWSNEDIGSNDSSITSGFSLPENLIFDFKFISNEIGYEEFKVKDINLNLNVISDSAHIRQMSFELEEGKIDIAAHAYLKDSLLYKKVWIDADLDEVVLDRYLSNKKDTVAKPTTKSFDFLENSELFLRLNIDRLKYQKLVLDKVNIDLETNEQSLTVKDYHFSHTLGNIRGHAFADSFLSPDSIDLQSTVKLNAVHTDSLQQIISTIPLSVTSLNTEKSNEPISHQNISLDIYCPQVSHGDISLDQLKSRIDMVNENVSIKDISFEALEGKFHLTGYMDREQIHDRTASLSLDAKHINLSKVIEKFDSNNQELFTGQHFQGHVNLDGNLLLKYDEKFNHQGTEMLGKVNLDLKDGQIINFKPITEALKVLRKEVTDTIFLYNDGFEVLFHNDEIVIPATRFGTNLSNIEFFGYHSKKFAFGFDMRVSIGDVLFKSQKKKKHELASDDHKLGGINYYVSARTNSTGHMNIGRLKKKVYFSEYNRLMNRYQLVDSTLTSNERPD